MDHPAPHPGPDPPQASDDSGRTSRLEGDFRRCGTKMAWEEARSMKHGGNIWVWVKIRYPEIMDD